MRVLTWRAVMLGGMLALALAGTSTAQHHAAPAPRTANLQGTDPYEFANNPHMREFYALSVATLGKGVKEPDIEVYERKAFAIFRAFGSAQGTGADAMQDHLKLIPRQVVRIAAEDPSVLANWDNFLLAMLGPR